MSNYAIGHNLSGYMPEFDTFVVAGWDEAIEALKGQMREYAAINDEDAWSTLNHDWSNGYTSGDYVETTEGVDFGDDTPSMLATVDSIIADEFGWFITNGNQTHAFSLGIPVGFHVMDNNGHLIYFWIAPTDEPIDE